MITHAQRTALFGSFTFERHPVPGNPEAVTIDQAWTRANLVSVRIPQLPVPAGSTAPRPPAPAGRSATIHKLARLPLLALWAAWEREGLLHEPVPFNGAWVARFKRQSGTEAERARKCVILGPAALSNHAWGTAFDIFAQALPLGRPCTPGHRMIAMAAVAKQLGWEWGGDYKNRPDPMHLELVRL